jgi:hypothetical protein
MAGVAASLLARHVIPLPVPEPSADLSRSVAPLRRPVDEGKWMAVHVLYTECRCSRLIAEHLRHDPRPEDLGEHVLLVGEDRDLAAALRRRGLAVRTLEPQRLSDEYGIDAAPLLIVVAPDGVVRYAGGYTARKQGPAPRDLEIIARLRGGARNAALPVYGCATSRQLRRDLNPLDLP